MGSSCWGGLFFLEIMLSIVSLPFSPFSGVETLHGRLFSKHLRLWVGKRHVDHFLSFILSFELRT